MEEHLGGRIRHGVKFSTGADGGGVLILDTFDPNVEGYDMADMRLVMKGKAEPRDALLQQAKVLLDLAEKFPAELDDAGWEADDTTALETNIGLLEGKIGDQAQAWITSEGATRDEGKAIDMVKAYLRRLRNALPRALREAGSTVNVTMASFAVDEALGRSTPKLSAYLTRIRPSVVALDAQLARAFKARAASAELDLVKAALDGADATQEVALGDAPEQTLRLYELMGTVLEQIEDLNRAGRTAFDGDSQTRARFNKDILLRGREAARAAKAVKKVSGGVTKGE